MELNGDLAVGDAKTDRAGQACVGAQDSAGTRSDRLELSGADKVHDLTPLAGMPLQTLRLPANVTKGMKKSAPSRSDID